MVPHLCYNPLSVKSVHVPSYHILHNLTFPPLLCRHPCDLLHPNSRLRHRRLFALALSLLGLRSHGLLNVRWAHTGFEHLTDVVRHFTEFGGDADAFAVEVKDAVRREDGMRLV